MNMKYARCGMYNGSTLIVQHTHSTLEREGMMAFAQRWIDMLAPGCDGEVTVSSSLYDQQEFMHQNINAFTNLVVLRDNIQLQLHLRDGAWPESAHDGCALTLLNADHEPLHTWRRPIRTPLDPNTPVAFSRAQNLPRGEPGIHAHTSTISPDFTLNTFSERNTHAIK